MVALLSLHGAAVAIAIALPFGFYTFLWKRPQEWVKFCGQKNVDPSHRMAQISHALKVLQILALVSVATNFSSLPPWYAPVLFVAGQYLNLKTYELLGEAGVYYGAIFGKQLPWVEKFPFGYIRDPQYWGSILSLLGVSTWIPFKFILLWILGYFYMMILEREENPDSRSSKVS
ncbi:unnamed protein product [Calypogeia fissa]